MMKKVLILVFFCCTISLISRAQAYKETDLGIKTTVNSTEIEVQYYSSSIVRVIKWPKGTNFNKESLSVIKPPQVVKVDIKQKGDEVWLQSKSVETVINLSSGAISFHDIKSNPLLSEKQGGTKFTDFDDAGSKTFTVTQSFLLDKDESIYGLGILQREQIVQRDLSIKMIQNNTQDYVTFFQSVKGYGLFWDNYSPTVFTDNEKETSFESEVGDCIDYYFMFGGNADGVIAEMRDLTGGVPMFPLWTYGYWQSKERYKSQDETVGIVKKYREIGVPFDGIIQDWQYWGNNYLWNAMDFLNTEFYDPKKMVDDVHNLNAHIIISIWSSFGPETKPYKELKSKGMLMDFNTWPQSGSQKWPPNMDYPSGVVVYDAYNPEARDIYWKYLKAGVFSTGMDGWWMDSTEPDHMDFKPKDFDNKTFLGSFRKVRNAFPLMTVGGVYDHQRKETSDKRVFILTRSAFAGQQRYGANTWTGDVVASWEALKAQISGGLNFSLCGIPYWNTDIGGFFLWNFKKKLEDAEYRELYTRWLQFGAFTPMMRSHGTDAPREIYQFGKKGEVYYDAIEKGIKLRYSLLPYIYSESWQVTANNSTMTRALMMDFADDKQALEISDEYMFGKSLLVCPVTESMYSKETKEDFSSVKSVELYLPKGSQWIDFWTGKKHDGGQTISREVPLDLIPLYVKSGTILPVGPDVQYANEKKWDQLEIRIYEGADGQFTLYEDEFDNYNYEKGSYSTIDFSWNNEKKTLTINDRKGTFQGMLKDRKFNIIKVSTSKGIGIKANDSFDKVVNYSGKKVVVKL